MANRHRCRNAYILATRDAAGKPARMVIFPDEKRSIVLNDFDDDLIVPANPPLVHHLDEIQATAIWQAMEEFAVACDAANRRGADLEPFADQALRRLAMLVLAPESAGHGPDTLAA